MARRAGIDFKIDERSTAWDALRRTVENLKTHEGAFVKVGVVGAKAAREHPAEIEPGKESEVLRALLLVRMLGGDARKTKALTNGELARIHEFGVPGRIPARPFILGTFALNRSKYLGLLKTKILPGIYLAKITAEQGLKIMGQIMAKDIRNRIVDGAGIPPPNAPATVAAKRRRGAWNKKGRTAGAEPRPLVDTGRLRNSVSYAVVLGGSESTPGPSSE